MSAKNTTPLNEAQHEQMEYAQRRINQKKKLYYHFVLFLIGSVFLILLNKVFKYGADYNWFKWAILFWAFLFVIHIFNVFITHRFMGRDWERGQREKLVEKQQKRIAEIAKEVSREEASEQAIKKKSTWES
ncbi:MAG: 2TM domain-containing protein [Bacteroidia bacterium]|nr:2TM domain-containing protein [Bacteroidia bacterium]